MIFVPVLIGAGVMAALSPTIRKEATSTVMGLFSTITQSVAEVFSDEEQCRCKKDDDKTE